MFSFFANIFGYLLNFLYNLLDNYGLAIIIFSVLIKIILLPISIKQQKTMKKSAKMQAEIKEIQYKYKENPEKMNQEVLELYKREKMSPFSGCLTAIVQIILLLSIFYLVRSPLTYMKKVDTDTINSYIDEIKAEGKMQNANYPEIEVIKQKGQTDEKVNINMKFIRLDLSDVPTSDLKDYRVYIIPILYVISSMTSMKITSNMQKTKNKEEENKKEDSSMEAIDSANRTMSYTLPIMSVMIAFVAPLGLALYWLVNNILMIIERILLNIFLKEKEEE